MASPSFTIDSISGEVFTSSALDYESSSPYLFKLKIVASDNGTPRKSSFVFIYIEVLDVNDHCPIFDSSQTKWFNISQHTHPGTLLTVISASDQDSGLNGEVRYSISNASSHSGDFKMGEENGELTIVGELKVKEYRLLIVARDLGKPSCFRQTDVTVNVFVKSVVTVGPSEISTTENIEGIVVPSLFIFSRIFPIKNYLRRSIFHTEFSKYAQFQNNQLQIHQDVFQGASVTPWHTALG